MSQPRAGYCCLCGAPSPGRAIYCLAEACQAAKTSKRAALNAAILARREVLRAETGYDPAHGGEAARKRGETIARSNRERPRRQRRHRDSPPEESDHGGLCA